MIKIFFSSSWPKEVVTNGNAQNGHAESSSGTDGDSESDGDNEDALFGTGKKRKRKKPRDLACVEEPSLNSICEEQTIEELCSGQGKMGYLIL